MSTTHHHGGLQSDLDKLLAGAVSRRQSLRWLFAGAAAVPLYGCGGGGTDTTSTGTLAGSTPATTTTTTSGRQRQLLGDPGRDGRAVSGRRHQFRQRQGGQRPGAVGHQSPGHPLERRRRLGRGDGRGR